MFTFVRCHSIEIHFFQNAILWSEFREENFPEKNGEKFLEKNFTQISCFFSVDLAQVLES
ncbi:MAG: hypothetical protein D6748_16300 [Calditrichaeota bacterium]|nr:MAG: hypothetical protein D6748_16300 [Calditrichota bacterium]